MPKFNLLPVIKQSNPKPLLAIPSALRFVTHNSLKGFPMPRMTLQISDTLDHQLRDLANAQSLSRYEIA
ncbi:hypothetical protein THMIRHAT_00130 [Thiosulfativibrio zosterae]|uniref:Uncharacterized protein n=1 Tax=Thiosulfativibrio zosterae TaxID=2675053 RepID=A0A6F8PJN2_9GAMM|nr:hypothetical protein THMIRHAT_00130 [Thiosulfativibrio zosterae]